MKFDRANTFCFKVLTGLLLFGSGVSLLHAHGSERGMVMLLPTGYYQIGGAVAVIASFVLLAWIPVEKLSPVVNWSVRLSTVNSKPPAWPSLLSFTFLCLLLTSGYAGNTDPLANPLPLVIWTWWWVGFTILQCIFGDLWQLLNPWTGMTKIIRQLFGLPAAFASLPQKLNYVPAIIIFSGFAWFELVDLAPDDPYRLANAVVGYWCFTLCGCLVFGDKTWLGFVDPFAIFFRLIGGLSPFARDIEKQNDDRANVVISLGIPGRQLVSLEPLPFFGVLFVLLTLSAVSFDGLSKTFTWLDLIGINPLEFPGRSAVTGSNTIGLMLVFVLLTAVFLLSVFLGCALIRRTDLFQQACGRLIYSIIPISLVFHLAHYLTLLLTNSQYSLLAFNDPFNLGWNLLAANDYMVTTSFLTHFHSVTVIWSFQTLVIVLGHVTGISLAHLIAIQLFSTRKAAAISQGFLAVLMILYTLFGLWLLSTPAIP